MTDMDLGFGVFPEVFDPSEVGAVAELDDSTATNGPLRVLAGTHRLGVLRDHELIRLPRECQAMECLSPAGGVVAMRPLLVHASSKAVDKRRRRVLHIEHAAQLGFPNGLELAMA